MALSCDIRGRSFAPDARLSFGSKRNGPRRRSCRSIARSHAANAWVTGARVEFTGEATSKPGAGLVAKLTRTAGPDSFGPRAEGQRPVPKTLTLECVTKSVHVHPAFATLVAGWKNNDDMMEPASWAPPRTDAVDGALVCKLSEAAPGETLLLPFTPVLVFVAGKKNAKEETAGVEWAFVNSDMVIQQGALRWIPELRCTAMSLSSIL